MVTFWLFFVTACLAAFLQMVTAKRVFKHIMSICRQEGRAGQGQGPGLQGRVQQGRVQQGRAQQRAGQGRAGGQGRGRSEEGQVRAGQGEQGPTCFCCVFSPYFHRLLFIKLLRIIPTISLGFKS